MHTLSNYRLKKTASVISTVEVAGLTFDILKSRFSVVDQYYVVIGWRDLPPQSRIVPIAHINKTRSGKSIVVAWQPERFSATEDDLNNLIKIIENLDANI